MIDFKHGISVRKPRVSVISYKGLSRLVQTVMPEYSELADIEVEDILFDDALIRARELERSHMADVIISAGVNAGILRAALMLPVVTIKPSAYDMMLALTKARHHAERVGVISFRETMVELDAIKDLLKIDVSQRAYQSEDDVEETFHALVADGFKVFVGSSLVCDLAQRSGLTGILVYRLDSVREALNSAIEIARVSSIEAARFEQLNGILQHLHEAVLAVDNAERITAINPLMEYVLGATRKEVSGRLLSELAPTLSIQSVLDTGVAELETVMQLGQATYISNRIPIREHGSVTGAVLTLQDAHMIHRADSNIRTQHRQPSHRARYHFEQIVGPSDAMAQVRKTAESYARANSTVLIMGESGTGKELFAQAIHNASKRRNRPFVAVNCAALPEPLLESELFGYDEGAFTGSRKGGKAGLFEFAHTGTIFLDEIGDMPKALQTRLLRVLQEKEIMRLGGSRTLPVDVRVIAASNRVLADMVSKGHFRDDLYYRLNILHLFLPPLRQRSDDIPALAVSLLKSLLQRMDSVLPADQALRPLMPLLLSYHWPGNVRELENIMERFAVFLSDFSSISMIDYDQLRKGLPELGSDKAGIAQNWLASDGQCNERESILKVLKETKGNRQLAARRLGMSRSTLWRRLRQNKIEDA